MYYREITRHSHGQTSHRDLVTNDVIPLLGETKEQCYKRHRARCLVREGDTVCFKKPKRNKVYGVVKHIEEDYTKVTWTQKGLVPNYISVEIHQRTREGTSNKYTVKTHEGKIMWSQHDLSKVL